MVTFIATDATSLSATCQVSIVVQVVHPQIIPSSISYSGGTFSGSFQTQNGVNYRVEYKDNLNAPSWTQLAIINGDGTVKSFSDPGPLPVMRFYQITPIP